MKPERLAVIDLGSNTFHLLIGEVQPDGAWISVYRERRYVKLASGGLDHIDTDRMDRALHCMSDFADTIRQWRVNRVRAIGTSAMREAGNGTDLADRIQRETGIQVEIIDGHREAGYILRGIRSCLPARERPGLIMDIGGGSVEFILFQGEEVLFAESFRIGVAVMFRQFHHSDPMSAGERAALESAVGKLLTPVWEAADAVGPYDLIGASGSFEILHDEMSKLQTGDNWAELDTTGLPEYLDRIARLDLHHRRQIPNIPLERVDYVVVSFLLILLAWRRIPPSRLFYCDFALKEGIMDEMIVDNF